MVNLHLRLAAAAGFCALFMTACAKRPAAESDPPVPVQVAETRQESIQRIITAEGILHPKSQASVMPKISAPVRAFYVNRGDHVRQGQLLAVLENRDLAATASENKGLYDQATATYRTTTAATLPEEMAKAQTDVQSSKQALESSQKLYESRQQLFKDGALARRLVDEANVAYVQAKSTYDTAVKHLESLQNVSRQEQVKGAQGQLQAAKSRYQGAEAQLAYSQIRSPISGVVTDRPLYAGEMASTGAPLVTVMDTSRVIARISIPERQAAYLKVGLPATITSMESSVQAPGKVTVVSPALDPNSTTVEVWVEAPNPGARLRPGVTVHVSFQAGTVPIAVVIPQEAVLSSQDGGTSVMVVGGDSKAHERKIEVGIRQPEKVQVTSGLQPGERVVTVGGVGLQDGTTVRVETPAKRES